MWSSYLRLQVLLTVLLTLLAFASACVSDFIGFSNVKLNRSIHLDLPIDNGVVTFTWDCQHKSILRYELIIELLRITEQIEDGDGHGHSRGNLPRGTVWRRFVDRNEHVKRSRYIIVKSIAPTTCEYRTEELQTNSVYSVFIMAVNNNEEPFACSNNQTFHTSARVIQHMVITTEVLLSMGLVFLLWFCAVGAFLRQWKFVQLSTPYEATRHYKPQNVDQIRIINREEDGIIYRHSVAPARRTASAEGASVSEQSAARIDDPCSRTVHVEQDKSGRDDAANGGMLKSSSNRVPKKERSMPCVKEMASLEPLIDSTRLGVGVSVSVGGGMSSRAQTAKDACSQVSTRPGQQLTVLVATDMLSKAKSSPNIFITDLCTE